MNKLTQILFTLLICFIELSATFLLVSMLYFTRHGQQYNKFFDVPVNPSTLLLSFVLFIIVSSIATIGMYATTHPNEL